MRESAQTQTIPVEIRKFWKPPEEVNICDWIEGNVILTEKSCPGLSASLGLPTRGDRLSPLGMISLNG
jgi:hypothetical protein